MRHVLYYTMLCVFVNLLFYCYPDLLSGYDILIITILAVIAGADGWEDIENYGLSKQEWLENFLELPNGIPSDDTFRRVFERLDHKILEEKLSQWLQQIMGSVVS